MKNRKEIHDLIEQYDFQSLSKQQKEDALKDFTEQEYTALRKTHLAIQDKATKENVEIKPRAFDYDRTTKNTLVRKILDYKIPVYKLVAALVVLFVSVYLIRFSTTQDEVINTAKVQPKNNSEMYQESKLFNGKNSLLADSIARFGL